MKLGSIYKFAYTLVEILCVISVIAILTAIALPVYMSSRTRARQTECVSNLRQISTSIALYMQDYDGTYPPVSQTAINDLPSATSQPLGLWSFIIRPYRSGGMPICPESEPLETPPTSTNMSGYTYNSSLATFVPSGNGFLLNGKAETEVKVSQLTVLVFDARTGIIAMSCPDDKLFYDHFPSIILPVSSAEKINRMKTAGRRHSNGANYAFLDGHVKWLQPEAFSYQCDGVKPCFHL